VFERFVHPEWIPAGGADRPRFVMELDGYALHLANDLMGFERFHGRL
jgi:hypothetical protein